MSRTPTPLLLLCGPPQSGKTTLAQAALPLLADVSGLLVDGSADRGMTRSLLGNAPLGQTLSALAARWVTEGLPEREAVDWQLQNLIRPVNDTLDLLTLGALPERLPLTVVDRLQYGLPRLLRPYAWAIGDDLPPAILRCYPRGLVRPVLVMSALALPEPEAITPYLQGVTERPGIVLNRVPETSPPWRLPVWLDALMSQSDLRLLAKLPQYTDESVLDEHLPRCLQDVLLRLNLPAEWRPTPS